DEPLGAVDDPVAGRLVPPGPGPGGRDVTAGLGLRQRERDQELARCEVREPSLLLLVAAGEEEREAGELLDGDDQAAGRADAADLLDGEADGQEVAADASVPLGIGNREDVVARQELLVVPREFCGPVDVV